MTSAVKGIELATAYISINARTDGMAKQIKSALAGVGAESRQAGAAIGSNLSAGIRTHLDSGRAVSMFRPIELAGVRWAVKAGAAVGGALKTAIAGALGGLGIGAIFGVGGVLGAGLDRLKTLQQSTVQLSLKLNPDEIKRMQSEVRAAVEGTPIPLDKAMQAVPKAVSAGMNTDEVKQLITDLANMTASTGGQASFEQLAVIMDQVRSKAKLTGEEMQQLIDAGVDVRGVLKQAFGWDDKTLEKNLKRGKVGAKELQTAIQQVYGSVKNADGSTGLAKRMGETFDGALGNLKASAARLGANFIAAILGKKADEDPLKDFALGIGSITEGLNGMGRWVDEHRDDIHEVFQKGGAAAGWIGQQISQVGPRVKGVVDWFRQLGERVKEVGNWFSTTWDKAADGVGRVKDKVGSVVGGVVDKVQSTFTTVRSKIEEIFGEIQKKFDSIFGENGWIAQQFDKLGKLVDKVRDVLGLGPATANAAAPGGFNPGPMAPGAFGPYASRSGLAPGTRLDGSDQKLSGIPAASSAGRVPYGLPPGTNTGGYGTGSEKTFPDWVMQIAEHFGIKPSTYAGHQQDNRQESGYAPNPNNLNRGIDWTGPVENLQRFADYLATVPDSLEQVIWENPYTHQKTGIGGGKINPGYYDQGTYDVHGGNDPGNIHVHTRQSMSIPLPMPVPAASADGGGGAGGGGQQPQPSSSSSLWDKFRNWISRGDQLPGYESGGSVWGAGTATSDSIPAWLSNGEHVLTAADVEAMGGQKGVYAFRNALQGGSAPGFSRGGAVGRYAPGGAVDPDTAQNAQDNLADLANQNAVAQARLNEVLQGDSPSQSDILSATQQMEESKRRLSEAQADLPMILAGGTPPDRSAQSRVYDTTNQLELAQQRLLEQQESGEDVPYSQQLQSQYAVDAATRERDQAVAKLQGEGQSGDYGQDFLRSMGYMPSGAGSSTVAGTSSLAGFINMGNSVVSGVIDTGVNLANTAATAAIAAGSMGSAAAAGPAASMAASYGIQLAGNTAKRISSYWFGLAGIGADAALEIFSPFGVPRALGYDYAGMMPQTGIQEAALTTVEKMGTDAINKSINPGQGGTPVIPAVRSAQTDPQISGSATAQMSTPPTPPVQQGAPVPAPSGTINTDPLANLYMYDPFRTGNGGGGAGGGSGGGGSWAKGGPVGIYDSGGILEPGQLAFNASRTPENVLTQKQWNAMAANASSGKSESAAPLVGNLYAQDMQDAIRQLEKTKRREAMQYSGRR